MKRYYWLLLLLLPNAANAERLVALSPLEPEFHPSSPLITEIVSACLSHDKDMALVERDFVRAMANEQSHTIAGHTDSIRTGKLRGIEFIITGSIAPINNNEMVTLIASDLATTKQVASATAMLSHSTLEKDTCALTETLAEKISAADTATPSITQTAEQGEEEALLMKAIAAHQNGKHTQAISALLKLLRKNANNADAHFWLVKTYEAAGKTSLAKSEAENFAKRFPDYPKLKEIQPITR